MAKNNNVNNNKPVKKNTNTTKPKSKEPFKENSYRNPLETKMGKLLIWILVFGMIGLVIISTVWVIVDRLIG